MSTASSTASSTDSRDTWIAFAASMAIVLIFAALIWVLYPAGGIETRSGRGQFPVPFVRHGHIGLLLGAAMLAMAVPPEWLRRKRAVSAAGQLLIRLDRSWVKWWELAFYAIFGIGGLALLIMRWFIEQPMTVDDLGSVIANTMLFTVAAVSWRLRPPTLEIRQRGLVWNCRYCPWDVIQDHSWSADGSKLRLKIPHYGFVNFRADPSRKDEIDQLFLEHRRRAEHCDRKS